jgi:hypothetical protein
LGGNCSCADYLTLTWLLYFSLSLLCLNVRANSQFRNVLYKYLTRTMVSASCFSFLFSICQFYWQWHTTNEWMKKKREIQIPVHSIKSWQDIWALYFLSFIHHSILIVLTDWFLLNFTQLSYAKKKKMKEFSVDSIKYSRSNSEKKCNSHCKRESKQYQ